MLYLSQIIGRPVVDRQANDLGRVRDVFVSLSDEYPPVSAILVSQEGRDVTIPFTQVQYLADDPVELAADADAIPAHEPPLEELPLARDVMDKEVVDVDESRVTRVNDVQFDFVDGQLRLLGVDVSGHGLLRRLGISGALDKLVALVGYQFPEDFIPWSDVELLRAEATGLRLRAPHAKIARLHPADIATIINHLSPQQSNAVLQSLSDETAAETLEEIDPERQASLLQTMNSARAADILEHMDPDNAADLLADLPEEMAEHLLSQMESDEAEDVRELLTYHEDTAGGLMTTDYVTSPASVTAREALELIRAQARQVDEFYHVYVVDDDDRLCGTYSLRDLLAADPEAPVSSFMEKCKSVPVDANREEIAQRMAKYDLVSLAVVDSDGRLRGVVTVDDAMEPLLPSSWKAKFPRLF